MYTSRCTLLYTHTQNGQTTRFECSQRDTVICDSSMLSLNNNKHKNHLYQHFYQSNSICSFLNTIHIKFIIIDCLIYNLKSQLIKREFLEKKIFFENNFTGIWIFCFLLLVAHKIHGSLEVSYTRLELKFTMDE